jgi:hypothetical protein
MVVALPFILSTELLITLIVSCCLRSSCSSLRLGPSWSSVMFSVMLASPSAPLRLCAPEADPVVLFVFLSPSLFLYYLSVHCPWSFCFIFLVCFLLALINKTNSSLSYSTNPSASFFCIGCFRTWRTWRTMDIGATYFVGICVLLTAICSFQDRHISFAHP